MSRDYFYLVRAISKKQLSSTHSFSTNLLTYLLTAFNFCFVFLMRTTKTDLTDIPELAGTKGLKPFLL
jgi:hypothetical protein